MLLDDASIRKARLVEIRLYYLAEDLLRMMHDIDNVLSLIQLLTTVSPFKSLQVQNMTVRLLEDPKLAPVKNEAIVLMYEAGYTVREIKRYCHCSAGKITQTIRQFALDPFVIVHNFSTEQTAEAEKALRAFEILQKAWAII